MTIYKNKRASSYFYRKIYIQHHGSIPKDETGRSYDIHHIDGDHTNNDILNLKALTIQEHYEIHNAQRDWAACLFMSKRMSKSPKEISELARLNNLDNRIYCFQNKMTNEIVNMTQYEFYTTYNLNRSNLCQLLHGRLISTQGWTLLNSSRTDKRSGQNLTGNNNPNFDHVIYCFEHRITKEQVRMTRNDFIKTYDIDRRNIHDLIKGNVKTVKKWRLIER